MCRYDQVFSPCILINVDALLCVWVPQAELLLTQYQAQLTSTLRQCLQPDASDASATPTMRAVACQAITELLHSGISSDKLVLQRFIRLLAGLLQNRSVLSQWAQVYDGRAITSVLLAHLAALSDLQYAMKHKVWCDVGLCPLSLHVRQSG